MSGSLRRGFYSGLVAGIVAGLSFTFFRYLDSIAGLYVYLGSPNIASFGMVTSLLGYIVGTNGIFGGIFGIIYSILHAGIPRKGVGKAIMFGLLVGVITDITIGSYFLLELLYSGMQFKLYSALGWIVSAFTQWVPYGIVLGWLYEKVEIL